MNPIRDQIIDALDQDLPADLDALPLTHERDYPR